MTSKASNPGATELRGVLVEAARVQLITVGAAVKFWARWAESAERYTKALDEELETVTTQVSSRDAVARLADVSRGYLREIADLPKEALEQFTRDLEKVSQPRRPQAKRTRSARAKN
jgi:hypothetical protein